MTERMEPPTEVQANLPEGFRMTELGPLPKEWQVVRLGTVATIGNRRTNLSPQAIIPFIPMTLVPQDSLYISRWEMRMQKDVRSGVLVREGDLLLAKITPCLENGKQGIVKGLPSGWAYASTEVYPIRTEPSLQTEFLALYLRQPAVRHALANKMEGTTGRQRLPKTVLQTLLVPLPPLSEQRAIVKILCAVQRAREVTEKVISAAKDLKQSLMRYLFTYGPVPIEQAEQVALQETDIGLLPEHWRLVRLGDLFDIQQGKALSSKQREGKNHRPFLRTANVHWGRIDLSVLDTMNFTEEETQRFSLQYGDLLVCEGGDIGRTAMWRGEVAGCCYQNHLHRLRAKSDGVEPLFYAYWMQVAIHLRKLYINEGNKTTIPNLSKNRLSAFLVPLPPLFEQQEITNLLEAVDRKIQAEEIRLAVLDQLFKTLLHHLMTGVVRVKDLPIPETKGVV